MVVLSTAGDQVPEMLFVDVAGKLKASPLQMSAIGLKVGVDPDVTSTVIVTSIAHCPGFGVKVYVVVAVLSATGDQVPTMPLVLPIGKFKGCPGQIGGI